MSPRTLFLSRLIGLYCILVALSMMTRRQATVETVTTLLQNPSMMLILGVITLVAGLAMVLAHNIWSGGALAVIVTLVGWMTLIKSLFFLFLPPELEAGFSLRHFSARLRGCCLDVRVSTSHSLRIPIRMRRPSAAGEELSGNKPTEGEVQVCGAARSTQSEQQPLDLGSTRSTWGACLFLRRTDAENSL